MKQTETSWFCAIPAVGGNGNFRCASCQETVDLGCPSLDHHPSSCPSCGIECLFWSGQGRNFQIVPELAPAPLREAIRWAQANLNELEFVELVVAFEELATKTS